MEHVINIKCDAQCSAPSNQNSEIENKRVIDLVAAIHDHRYNLRIFHGVQLNFVIDKSIFNFFRFQIEKVDFHARQYKLLIV